MAAPYAYPPGAHRNLSPVTHLPPGAHRNLSPVAHLSRCDSSSRQNYNPAVYQGSSGGNGGPFARRPSASPMRGIAIQERQDPEQYNPQSFGPVGGNGGAFMPSQRTSTGEEAPPPYSPPSQIARNQSLHVDPSHRRQSSWPNPISPDNGQTPSTGTRAAFSPYTAPSTANTTPLSPGDSGSWFARRQQTYTPATPSALNQPSYPDQAAEPTPPASVRNPSAPPRTVGNVPPPPPGPPPAANRSASVTAPPIPIRSLSRPRAIQIPPPPSNLPPPQRTGSLRRAAAGMASNSPNSHHPMTSARMSPGLASPSPRMRSFSQPMSPTQEEFTPPIPPIPPVVPPKRKIEDESHTVTSYRENQRASPKQMEEDGRAQREGSNDVNNPYRNGLAREHERASPPRLTSPLIRDFREYKEPERSPLIDLTSPIDPRRESGQSMMFRRKPISPTLTTPRQLPTPPPQQPSPPAPVPGESALPGPSRNTGKNAVPEMGFLDATRRRYREMLVAEDAVASPALKLRRFMEFLTKECKVRQELYRDQASEEMQKLVRINAILNNKEPQPDIAEVGMTPVSEDNIPDDEDMVMTSPPDIRRISGDSRPGRETQWWGQNLTVAAFDQTAYDQRVRDEESSRGRTSSRWWETSGDGGSISAVRSDGLADDESGCAYGPRRSGRHSKAPRASLREIAEFVTTPRLAEAPDKEDTASYLNSPRFPPDRKQYVSASRSRSRAPGRRRSPRRRAVKTSLDIAPLLTLLPSYPLPYPAANNSHPQLEVFRTLVRTLSQLDGLKNLHNNFSEWSKSQGESASAAATKRRNMQAERIQNLYHAAQQSPKFQRSSRGNAPVDFSAIEASNAAFESSEAAHRTSLLQAEFDEFSRAIVDPAHRDLHERITAATAAYVDLVALIDTPAQPTEDPENPPPELLEKLTAAKWIFDVRETLHKHVFDLLTARNDRYKALVLAPLVEPAAIADATDFFDRDTATRATTFTKDRRARTTQFQTLVNTHVTRAVETARSTFWDVAPLVGESLAKIPESLTNVVPIVPPEEYHDSPEFLTKPLRYLEVKLKHAEKSVYALVETQTELLCLEHAVQSLEVGEDTVGGGGIVAPPRRLGRREEELTRELKEKVRLIEDEWREGLGAVFDEVRNRVEGEVERLT